nr:MAG TPA: hypothetical protein [Caudoviricetes sp.]
MKYRFSKNLVKCFYSFICICKQFNYLWIPQIYRLFK